MSFKKLASSLFLFSVLSFVNVSCTNPSTASQGQVYTTTLSGSQEVPPNNSPALGTATLTLSSDEKTATVTYDVKGLSGTQTAAHIHGPAKPGVSADVVYPLTGLSTGINLDASQLANLKAGNFYVNVHSDKFPAGEVRGQLASK